MNGLLLTFSDKFRPGDEIRFGDVAGFCTAMGWFDTTPVGRILNVFSSDMMDLDLQLPQVFRHWQFTISIIVVALIPTMVLMPQTVPLVLTLLCCCAWMREWILRIWPARWRVDTLGPWRTDSGTSGFHMMVGWEESS